MNKLIVVLGALFILSGCQLTRVEGELHNVDVKVGTRDDSRNNSGKFCPPGQAKKGNC
ncbi:membrane lipoprotein lipid attachment site-containing protein [Vibrio casei]|uniref:membrane lipoprotein lipid attachment site-containing protein n=1 Tax=Vibrio casei TaxID=673372 RepID=UPI003F9853A5